MARAVNDATGREGAGPKGGRPPHLTVALLKIVISSNFTATSDEEKEYCLLDRMSWQTCTRLSGHRHLSDARTIWAFKEQLAKEGGAEALFEIVCEQLDAAGLNKRGGQTIDVTFITVLKIHLHEDETETIKEGQIPEHWSDNQAAHKDTDVRWTKKHDRCFYGYKARIKANQKHKHIRTIDLTPTTSNLPPAKSAINSIAEDCASFTACGTAPHD